MNKLPTVSIITVCLNEKARIRKTINSIIAQTIDNYEWIVIDGGSEDGTLDIIEEYGYKINKLVSEKDQGIYHAMNKGIEAASGEYCVFLNGGDFFYDNFSLDRLCSIENKNDVMYGAEVVIMNGGTKKTNFLSPVINIRDFLYKQTLPHQSTFFKKSLFDQYGNFDLNFSIIADREFYARVLLGGNASLGYIPGFISVFHFDGLSNKDKHSKKYVHEVSRYRKKYFSMMYTLRLFLNTLYSKSFGRPV